MQHKFKLLINAHLYTNCMPLNPALLPTNHSLHSKYLLKSTTSRSTEYSVKTQFDCLLQISTVLAHFIWLSPPSVPWHHTTNSPISPPVHRNMPKDQAMDFVAAEYSRGLVKERSSRDPADIAAQASQLLDDFLDREKIGRHSVPSETRQLLMLLTEGVHLYPEELETISEYVRSRQVHAQGGTLITL